MKIRLLVLELFHDAYEVAFGVRPAFNVDHLSDAELLERTEQINLAPYFR